MKTIETNIIYIKKKILSLANELQWQTIVPPASWVSVPPPSERYLNTPSSPAQQTIDLRLLEQDTDKGDARGKTRGKVEKLMWTWILIHPPQIN